MHVSKGPAATFSAAGNGKYGADGEGVGVALVVAVLDLDSDIDGENDLVSEPVGEFVLVCEEDDDKVLELDLVIDLEMDAVGVVDGAGEGLGSMPATSPVSTAVPFSPPTSDKATARIDAVEFTSNSAITAALAATANGAVLDEPSSLDDVIMSR